MARSSMLVSRSFEFFPHEADLLAFDLTAAGSQPPPAISQPPPPAAAVEPARPKRRHDWGSSEEDVDSVSPTAQPPRDRTSSDSSNPTTTTSAATSLSPSAQQRSLDDARLASLNYTAQDVAALDTLMTPMDHPPSAEFDRTAQLEVNFGYLEPEVARKALERQGVKRAFGEDERMQLAYETFLRAQAGESRDLYTV